MKIKNKKINNKLFAWFSIDKIKKKKFFFVLFKLLFKYKSLSEIYFDLHFFLLILLYFFFL